MDLCRSSLFLSLLAAAWPVPATPQPPAPQGSCAVEGSVVNARSGIPLKMVDVTLQRIDGGASAKTRTAPGGRFSFADVQPGEYRLSAVRRGFVSENYNSQGAGRPGEILALRPGDQLRDLIIRLSPKGVIAGRVVDEDGEPVSEVQVQAQRLVYTSNGPTLATSKLAATDDLGAYRLYGLDPGRYYISASYRGLEPAAAAPGESYAPTYFPGTADPSAAVPFDVTAGSETLGADFSLIQTRTYRIRGRVVNTTEDRTVRGASVVVLPRGPSALAAALAKSASAEMPSGAFEIDNIIPGSYIVTAYWFEGDRRYFARQTVEVSSADVDGVYLPLGPGADLAGRFQVEGQGQIQLGQLTVLLQPKEHLPTGAVLAKVHGDGALSLKSLPTGEYDVKVNGVPKGFYLKSLRFAGEDVLRSGLRITGGQSAGELDGVLSSAGGVIEGTVRGDRQEPVERAQVVLVPDGEDRSQTYLYRVANTDHQGRFQIQDIAPGNYQLFAWKDLDLGVYLNPGFLRSVEGQGQPVAIQENSRQSMQLKLLSNDANPTY